MATQSNHDWHAAVQAPRDPLTFTCRQPERDVVQQCWLTGAWPARDAKAKWLIQTSIQHRPEALPAAGGSFLTGRHDPSASLTLRPWHEPDVDENLVQPEVPRSKTDEALAPQPEGFVGYEAQV